MQHVSYPAIPSWCCNAIVLPQEAAVTGCGVQSVLSPKQEQQSTGCDSVLVLIVLKDRKQKTKKKTKTQKQSNDV